jgi:UDPglucose--hexose-1-phosphate uridylyltransferase
MKSELRKDYIQEKYVIIAPRRNQRPHQITTPATTTVAPTDCVFCPKALKKRHAKILATVGPRTNWHAAAVANDFPAVSPSNKNAYGRQEIIIETPDHQPELHDLSVGHIADIFALYAERTKVLQKDKKIEYILTFKNDGAKAGASVIHAHSQIFATKFLPPNLKDKSERVHNYLVEHGSCVYCDVITKERKSPRLVMEDANSICFTPYASMHNYELWIMPKRHLDNITVLTAAERLSIAKQLKHALTKICQLGLPYNYYFHQVVHDTDQHLYLKITPRGSVWAGVEIGSGLIINPISPEAASKFYRTK